MVRRKWRDLDPLRKMRFEGLPVRLTETDHRLPCIWIVLLFPGNLRALLASLGKPNRDCLLAACYFAAFPAFAYFAVSVAARFAARFNRDVPNPI